MPSPQFFDGEALVSWSDPDITVAVPWYIGLMFRTRQPAGTLMQANVGPSSTINLMVRHTTHCEVLFCFSLEQLCALLLQFSIFPTIQVSEQQVRMEVLLRRRLVASLSFPQIRVNDGEWHHLLVELRSIKDGKDIKYTATVSLDYNMYKVQDVLLYITSSDGAT